MADEDLLIRIGLTEKQYLAAVARLEAQSRKAAAGVEKKFKGQNDAFVKGAQQANRAASGFANGGLRQIGMQLSQVAQQGAATGNYFTALSMQAADIGMLFGGVGIAVGSVLTVLGPFVYNMIAGGDAAEEAGKGVENFTGSVQQLQALAAIATTDIAELRREFGEFADEVQRGAIIAARAALSGALGSLSTASADVIANLDSVYTALQRVNEAAPLVDQLRATGGGAEDDLLRGAEENLRRLQEEARAAAESVGLTTLQAMELKMALAEIGKAEDMQQVAEAASAAQIMIEGMFDGATIIPPEIGKILEELQKVLEAAGRGAVAMGEIGDATEESAGHARVFVAEMSSADLSAVGAQAAFLAQQMGIAAEAAVAYNRALNTGAGLPDDSGKPRLGFGLPGVQDPYSDYRPGLGFGNLNAPRYMRSEATPPAKGRSGGASDAEKQDAREAARYIEQTRTETERLNAELKLLEDLNARGFFKKHPEAYSRAVAQVGEEMQRVEFDAIRTGVEGFTDALFQGGDALKDWARTAVIELAKVITQMMILKALGLPTGGVMGGSWLGSLFAGFFDGGGNIPSGKVGIAGEYGPELIRGPAQVTSRADTARMLGEAQDVNIRVVMDDDGKLGAIVERKAGAAVRRAAPGIVRQSVNATYTAAREEPIG